MYTKLLVLFALFLPLLFIAIHQQQEIRRLEQMIVDTQHHISEQEIKRVEADRLNENHFDVLYDENIDYDYRLEEIERALNMRP